MKALKSRVDMVKCDAERCVGVEAYVAGTEVRSQSRRPFIPKSPTFFACRDSVVVLRDGAKVCSLLTQYDSSKCGMAIADGALG